MHPTHEPDPRQLDSRLINFVEACSIVNSSLDMTRLLYSIVDVSVMLTDSRHGRILLFDPADPDRLVLRAAKGRRREGLLDVPVEAGRGASWLVTLGGESIMSNTALEEERFQWQPPGSDRDQIRKILCVPLSSQDGGVLGALELHDKRGSEFLPEDRTFIELLAQQAGASITSAMLFDQVVAERQWISTIVDSMSDGVIVTDARGDVVLANETARTLFDLDQEHRPIGDDLNLPLLLEEAALMDDGETFDLLLLKPRAEMLSVRVTAITDPSGVLRTRILSMRSVRELKEVERKNREFLSLVSHELESHYARLEKDIPSHLRAASGEVADLIANLVFYSEIESGPLRLERRGVDVQELLQNAADEMRPELEARSIELTIAAGAAASILADPERLEIVVKGLLRYVSGQIQDGGSVLCTLQPQPGSPEIVLHFEVVGTELTTKELGDLFDKTYQVENFISILGRQTAGLSLVFLKHIAEAHGGSFWAQRADDGTVHFFVSLRR